MSLRKLSSAIGAASLIVVAAPASATELVTNGGFETGNFSGWTQFGDYGGDWVSPLYAASGGYGARFGAIDSVGGITQNLSTVVGQQYRITFALSNLDGGNPNTFDLSFGGVSLMHLPDSSSSFEFTTFTLLGTATSESTALTFGFTHIPFFWAMDDISVVAIDTAVPEPGTWAMMLLGFGAIGGAVRYRKRKTAIRFA